MEKITILLAAYNGAQYIDQMIQSIQAQTATNWRLILSDDNSEDGTPEILERYAQEDSGRIVHYRSGQRFGCAQRHFMHLLEKFHDSEYIMFCDQDDVWHEDKVSKTLEKMKEIELDVSRPAMVHSDLQVVDSELRVIDPSFMHFSKLNGYRLELKQLLVQNVVTGCTMMINQALAAMSCIEIPSQGILMHDWWLALLAAACGQTGFLDEATMDYRQHGGNVIGAKNVRSFSYIFTRAKEGRKSIWDTFWQAKAFSRCFAKILDKEAVVLIDTYGALADSNGFHRRAAYLRWGFLKIGMCRVIGQFLLG